MSSFVATLSTFAPASSGDLSLEALAMYGPTALVIGLTVWSTYDEPPSSDPYAK